MVAASEIGRGGLCAESKRQGKSSKIPKVDVRDYVVGALVMAWKAHAIHGGTVYEGKTEQVKT